MSQPRYRRGRSTRKSHRVPRNNLLLDIVFVRSVGVLVHSPPTILDAPPRRHATYRISASDSPPSAVADRTLAGGQTKLHLIARATPPSHDAPILFPRFRKREVPFPVIPSPLMDSAGETVASAGIGRERRSGANHFVHPRTAAVQRAPDRHLSVSTIVRPHRAERTGGAYRCVWRPAQHRKRCALSRWFAHRICTYRRRRAHHLRGHCRRPQSNPLCARR